MDFISFFKEDSNDSRKDWALLVLRICAGGLMAINHGWGKLLKLFGDEPIKFADVLGMGATASLSLAVLAEFVASVFIVFGLLTRLSTIPAMITMAVAAFMIHWSDPFQKKELALIYLVMFLIIFLMGPGRLSLDWKIFGKK
jgi:putative oxidoreductase